jgi:hypothetical protein
MKMAEGKNELKEYLKSPFILSEHGPTDFNMRK